MAMSAQLSVYPALLAGWKRIAKTRFDATAVVLDPEVDDGLLQVLMVHCTGKAMAIAVRYESMSNPSGFSSAVQAVRAMSTHTEPATFAHMADSFTRLLGGAVSGANTNPELVVLDLQSRCQRFGTRFGVSVPE